MKDHFQQLAGNASQAAAGMHLKSEGWMVDFFLIIYSSLGANCVPLGPAPEWKLRVILHFATASDPKYQNFLASYYIKNLIKMA